MIENLIRENIKKLKPYSSARDDFNGDKAIFLDANENPFGILNRYPDPYQTELKIKLSAIKNLPIENIFIGNGSDEIIDLTMRVFCEPQKDKILICPPTYGMYEVYAGINDVDVIKVPLDKNFQLDTYTILETVNKENIKIIYLCSPNNPTGNNLECIQTILENFKGIVFIDEAYIDFSSAKSYTKRIIEFPSLIVSQTFSKAWGMAGVRVGVAFSSTGIIEFLNKIKPPYNVNELSQKKIISTLDNQQEFQKKLKTILQERDKMISQLQKIQTIQKIYPTATNFILIKIENASQIYDELVKRKIVIRDRSKIVANSLRITVGTPEENTVLLNELKNLLNKPKHQ